MIFVSYSFSNFSHSICLIRLLFVIKQLIQYCLTVTPHAKRAFFISFVSLSLSLLSCTLVIISYVTDIFNRTGSSLSEKNSSILISITQIIANLVLLNIVERINRRVIIKSCFSANSTVFTIIFFYRIFADTLHMVVAVSNGKLLLICRILFVLVQKTRIRMDATILCCLHRLFQLAWTSSDSIDDHQWNIS